MQVRLISKYQFPIYQPFASNLRCSENQQILFELIVQIGRDYDANRDSGFSREEIFVKDYVFFKFSYVTTTSKVVSFAYFVLVKF